MLENISENLHEDIEEILFDAASVQKRIAELGAQIDEDYRGKPVTLVGVLRGAMIFLSDLTRAISIPHSFDMAGASSYGSSTTSSGRVQITKDVEVHIRDRNVIICEDIFDSGRTLAAIRDLLRVHHPREIRLAAFLYKDLPARAHDLHVDYVGFHIPNRFVVGYGLDYCEMYRNLPYVGVLSPRVYQETPK